MDVRRVRRYLLIVGALALLASCGSSSSEASEAAPTGGDRTETSAASDTGGGDDSFCDLAEELEKLDDFFEDEPTDTSPETALRAMKENYGKLTSQMGRMRASAPEAMADDMAVILAAAEDANDQIQSAGTYEELEAVFQEVFGGEDAEAADAASERIDTYLEDECGISFED